MSGDTSSTTINAVAEATVNRLQDIIGTDVGGRGMKALIVPNDLVEGSRILASLPTPGSLVLVLTGFPCCVTEVPPTETDGPPGAVALARAAVQLGHSVAICTDDSNAAVLRAAMDDEFESWTVAEKLRLELQIFSSTYEEETRLRRLAQRCHLLLACERAGPSIDGICYTMRGINMNAHNVIAPIHLLVEYSNCPFVAIGDGGNELGMGRVWDQITTHIPLGATIGCVIAAHHLVAASVSNWGAYALAAGAAVMRASQESSSHDVFRLRVAEWLAKCLPTEQDEVNLLQRCIAKGCRDGVSGKVEATVDGMPLETSLQCLRDIREAALSLGGVV
jgi:D-glutamate cyclase